MGLSQSAQHGTPLRMPSWNPVGPGGFSDDDDADEARPPMLLKPRPVTRRSVRAATVVDLAAMDHTLHAQAVLLRLLARNDGDGADSNLQPMAPPTDTPSTCSNSAPTAAAAAALATPSKARPPAEQELANVMRAVQQGCETSFARLVRLTQRRLFAIVLRINRDRGESEDLVQDVFVKVWQNSQRFDKAQGDVMVWLGAVARHAAISSLRRRGSRPQARDDVLSQATAEPWDAVADMPCSAASPVQVAMRSQAAAALRRSMMRLTVDQRDCVSLAFYEGLSHQEIAERLGRPLGTVKSAVRRALLAMRNGLAGHTGGLDAVYG